MEIGEFSKETSLSIDTLRYYNKIGLLVPKRLNNIRKYHEEDLQKAIAIIKLKNAGFTLIEIDQFFKLDEGFDDSVELNEETKEKIITLLKLLERKHEEISKKEHELQQVKGKLEKMISKVNKLLECGYFFQDKDEII